ncbi:MAG: Asp23/Gls24 family envelope stress response protein [Defluviitaleaceae bacterium]|nr:Asp23/Gls24 family envelope stress response protein [Defluviitaleaceae bacterium]
MTEIKKESSGVVRIADEVLMVIAGTAAMEADGVLRHAWLSGGNASRKQMAKCTSVIVKNKTVTIGLSIAVRFGAKIHEVSKDVQQRVKSAVETMTGLTVSQVNVTVSAIVGEKKKTKA